MCQGKLANKIAKSPFDMFKQDEILLFICYSAQKSDIGTVVGLENIF